MTDNNIGQKEEGMESRDKEAISKCFHWVTPEVSARLTQETKFDGMEHKPDFEAMIDNMPVENKMKVENEMAFIDLITYLGYRENKMWTVDEDPILHKLCAKAKELADKQHKAHVLPLQSEAKIKEAIIRELEADKDSFAIGLLMWAADNVELGLCAGDKHRLIDLSTNPEMTLSQILEKYKTTLK